MGVRVSLAPNRRCRGANCKGVGCRSGSTFNRGTSQVGETTTTTQVKSRPRAARTGRRWRARQRLWGRCVRGRRRARGMRAVSRPSVVPPRCQAGAMPVMTLPSGFGRRLAGPARRPGGSGRSHHHLSGGALQLPRGTHRTMTTISVAVERRKMRVRASRFASKRS